MHVLVLFYMNFFLIIDGRWNGLGAAVDRAQEREISTRMFRGYYISLTSVLFFCLYSLNSDVEEFIRFILQLQVHLAITVARYYFFYTTTRLLVQVHVKPTLLRITCWKLALLTISFSLYYRWKINFILWMLKMVNQQTKKQSLMSLISKITSTQAC